MKNNKGFSFLEVFIASSIVFMMITTCVPLISLIQKERGILLDRRIISSHLHDELQQFLWMKKAAPVSYKKTIERNVIHFDFSFEDHFLKGCGTWVNIKDVEESICFNGLPKK